MVLAHEYPVSIPWEYVTQFVPFSLAGYVIAIVFGYVWPEFRSYAAASSIGCALKSTVLGFGIWGLSQFNISTIGQFQLPIDIGFLWIAEAHRGRGLGAMWLQELAAHYPGQKFWLLIDDYRLAPFYERQGFTVVKEIDTGRWPEWVMVWIR